MTTREVLPMSASRMLSCSHRTLGAGSVLLLGLALAGCSGGPAAGPASDPAAVAPAAAATGPGQEAGEPTAPITTGGAGALLTGDDVIPGDAATLVVHGMSCPLCANNVDKQLLDVKGVKNVWVDMGTGEVRVQLVPGVVVTRDQLAGAVDRSGFTLAEVRAR